MILSAFRIDEIQFKYVTVFPAPPTAFSFFPIQYIESTFPFTYDSERRRSNQSLAIKRILY